MKLFPVKPTAGVQSLPTLFRASASGKSTLYWTVEYTTNKVRARSGILGGKEKVGSWTEVGSTNQGRSNERTPYEQAEFVARSHWNKRKKLGFLEKGEKQKYRLFPMLAHTYEKGMEIRFPVYVQPKFNGIRCLVSVKGMFSRKGEMLVACPHIFEALAPYFTQYPNAVLDGELYNHALREKLNKTMSLVRKVKPTKEDLAESAKTVEFHIYDSYFTDRPEQEFKHRHKFIWIDMTMDSILRKNKFIIQVPTALVKDETGLEKIYKTVTGNGYEGAIIRDPDGRYAPRRTKALLKYKPWKDAEFKVVGFESGKGKKAGEIAAKVICEHITGKWKGDQFKSTIIGPYPYLRELYRDQDKPKGTKDTVRSGYYTEYGKPFHPEAVMFWGKKGKI
mgnify:CR=1 FL=1